MKAWQRKELVRNLRSQGLSYKEIRLKTPFSISKSTVGSWCKDIELTETQKERLNKLLKDGSYRGRLLGSKTTQISPNFALEKFARRADRLNLNRFNRACRGIPIRFLLQNSG